MISKNSKVNMLCNMAMECYSNARDLRAKAWTAEGKDEASLLYEEAALAEIEGNQYRQEADKIRMEEMGLE